MPIVKAASGGNLDSQFNAAVTKLRDWMKQGYKLYSRTLIDEIAILDMASQEAKTQLGLVLDGSSYRVCSLTDDTHYSENPPKLLAECGYSRMDLFGIELAELGDELYKMSVLNSMPQLAGKPVQLPLLEILGMLNDNPVTKYDDLSLFNTAHLVDPYGTLTASNSLTQPKTSAGWNAVLQAIMTRRDPGSKAATATAAAKSFMPNRDLTGKNLTIWCGDTGVASDLSKIFDPQSNWATIVESAVSAASETRKVFAQAAIQYVPEMSLYGTITNYCYILVNNTPNRAVYGRIPHAPRVEPIERIPSKHMSRVKAFQTWGKTTAWPWALYKWSFS